MSIPEAIHQSVASPFPTLLASESGKVPKVVIVGGGFGGLQVARNLRKFPVRVVLVDRQNYHTFQPLLYQVATGGLEPDSIAFPLRKIFINQKNLIFRVSEVTRVDAEKNLIETSIGPIYYDYLVLATGSTTNFFGNKTIEHYSMPMKSIVEAINLRSMLLQNMEDALLDKNKDKKDAFMTFVIVGGGPTGVEMAGALAELRNHVLPKDYPELDFSHMKIYLIESSDILASMSEKSTRDAKNALAKLGVVIELHKKVVSYNGNHVTLDDGTSYYAENVIWTAGVQGAAVQGLSAQSMQKGGRIKVNEFNQVNGYTNIFCIGDVASIQTEKYPHGIPGVAPAAIQQGNHLAKNLGRLAEGKPPAPFVYFDKGTMATIGRNKAVVDVGKLHLSGFIAWLAWMFVHLFYLVGTRNRVIVLFNWVFSYFSNDKGARVMIRPFNRAAMIEEPVKKPLNSSIVGPAGPAPNPASVSLKEGFGSVGLKPAATPAAFGAG